MAKRIELSTIAHVRPLPSIMPSQTAVTIIPDPGQAQAPPLIIGAPQGPSLALIIRKGAAYHPRASRGAFVEKVAIGYYAYERRIEYRTCILAAAYAGAFGPASVERSEFSYSEALFRLSVFVGYDLNQEVIDPVGQRGPLAERIIKLADDHYWTAAGVAEWVEIIEGRSFWHRAEISPPNGP